VERETREAPRRSENSFASEADIVSKFRKLTRHVLPEKHQNALIDAVLRMEDLDNASRLVELLHTEPLLARSAS
jgi:hypothetical protein